AMARRYAGDPAQHAAPMLSQWSKSYFRLAVPAALGVALVLRRPLEMSALRSAIGLRNGMPDALYLPEDALGEPDEDPAVRYRSLCDDHLEHVIVTLSGMARLAPRVLWNNAGDLIDNLFELSSVFPDSAGDQDWLFKAGDTFRSGEGNALRCPIRWVTPRAPRLGKRFRSRRVCCLRSEIPGEEMQVCSSCPKLLTMSDAELAEQESVS
ncbi:MAG: siderophore-iron reductase FhuF, partial [Janthinobacterium lividum]